VTLKGQVRGQQVAVDTKLRMQDTTISLDPLRTRRGQSKVTGQLTVTTGKPRPKIVFKLASPSLAFAELALPAMAGAIVAAPKAGTSPNSHSARTRSIVGAEIGRANGDLAIDALV
jgi:hypothetical protein